MVFCIQLRMILWKNLHIRKRQKFRCLMEIVWPIFLFLILMWVRSRGLRTKMHECHFQPKALVSAGSFPFAHSFFCTVNNTCHKHEYDAEKYNTINAESILHTYNTLKDLLKNQNTSNLQDTVGSVNKLSQLIQNFNLTRRSSIDPESRLQKLLKNGNIFKEGIDKQKSNLNSDSANSLLNSKVYNTLRNSSASLNNRLTSEELLQFSKLVSNINSNLNNLLKETSVLSQVTNISQQYQTAYMSLDLNNASWFQSLWTVTELFLCGRSKPVGIDSNASPFQPSQKRTRLKSLSEQLTQNPEYRYEYDPTVSPQCNALFQQFEESAVMKAIWWTCKPFVRGKLLYTPKTEATERIMKNLNNTFSWVTTVKFTLNAFQTYYKLSQSLFNDNTATMNLVKSLVGSNDESNLASNVLIQDLLKESLSNDSSRLKETVSNFVNKSNDFINSQSSSNFQQVIENMTMLLECFDLDKVHSYATEEDAVEKGMELLKSNNLMAVIVFENQENDTLSPFLTYKIRMDSDRVDSTEFIHDLLRQPGPRMRPLIDLKYFTFGFIYIQDLLEHYIIVEHTGLNDTDLPGYYLKQFPYPCHETDQFIGAISRTFPLIMVLSWVYTCAMIVKCVVYEKEQRLKETMHVMGLKNYVHWVGWFIDSLIPMFFTILLLTAILVGGKVLLNTEATVVYVFLGAYCLATIAQSFLISVFFSRANIAAACGGIIFFLLYLPYTFIHNWMLYLSPFYKTILCLSSNVALGLGASYFASYEERGTGLHWKDISYSPLYGDDFCLLYVIIMLLVDCFLYLLMTWYIEGIAPGQYGVPKPWYFPVTIAYWEGSTSKVTDEVISEKNTFIQNDHCEDEPTNLRVGISIHNLTKCFPNGKVAVKNLSLRFYENQITSFLGHNGAGKTTTISILTGLYTPTTGTAYINDMDIRTDMAKIRRSLGMCPQHNVLFDLLTVEEHLYFYARLRGLKKKEEVMGEVNQMIEDIQLPNKRTCLAKNLSGGMQRKLSIAVAFIGGSKTVILDEPTSGVDPYSRRSIWQLLMKYKKGRTVVLTTHFMDEADLLGDRIAIIANGELQCCGSSLFLKNHYGSGYYMTVDIKQNGDSVESVSRIQGVHDHVRNIVSSSQFVEQVGTELIYILPDRNNIGELKALFDSLEKHKSELHIDSYGISDTSLEEVFLRVAERGDPTVNLNEDSCETSIKTKIINYCCQRKKPVDPQASLEHNGLPETDNSSVAMTEEGDSINEEGNKYWKQFVALFIKRYHHNRRKKKALFSELVLPALFVLVTLTVAKLVPSIQQRPPLVLKPSMYKGDRVVFSTTYQQNNKSTADQQIQNWVEKYDSTMKGPVGLGVICSANYSALTFERPDLSCNSKLNYEPGKRNISAFGKSCSCESGSQICPRKDEIPTPPIYKLSSNEFMYDLQGSNVSNWLVKTWQMFEEERLGGYTLGYVSKVPNITIGDIVNLLMNFTTPEEFDKATTFKQNNIQVWFNNKGWTSSVSYLNAMNNVVLRSSLPPNKTEYADQYGIRAINHPMNFTTKQYDFELFRKSGLSLLIAISVIFVLSFVTASFVLYLIEDRATNSKHLQLVSGMNQVIYWTQAFAWDMMCYIMACILCIMIFIAFDEKAYISSKNFGAFLCLLFFYGFSCIPLVYPASFIFNVPSSAYVGVACANMFIGITTTMTIFVLSVFEDEDLKAIDSVLREVFLVFPHYCLGDGLMKLSSSYFSYMSFKAFDIEVDNNIFGWNLIGKNLFCMFISGIIYFLVDLLIEYKVFTAICYSRWLKSVKTDNTPLNEDEDVRTERERISVEKIKQDIILINNLTKVFPNAQKPSVNHICLGVKRGECFGLLGLNGAGKTTTFKMLTGAIWPTSGDAFINGHSVITDIKGARLEIGYCPQFDAVDAHLSPREHLEFYARVRNIPNILIKSTVDRSLKKLGLLNYTDRSAGTLSGGNKRKLSTAIAVLGNPSLILLDEPTSGMDPRARRFLWTTINKLVREGHSVILTSHSMEECQALCTRLTIMVNGELKCLGSSQHLKSKFGGGYRLAISCPEREESTEIVKEYIEIYLDKAILQEEHHTRLCYQLPPGSHSLSYVFSIMEDAREKLLITDYSLSQTTLEDVFLKFASEEPYKSTSRKFQLRTAFLRQCSQCCKVMNTYTIWMAYSLIKFCLKKMLNHFYHLYHRHLHHHHHHKHRNKYM